MLMPGRQFGQGESFPGVLVNGTTTVNGYTLPIDLFLTSRGAGDAAEYVASNSVDFGGEFESSVSDEFTAYIADGTYAGTGNQVTGGGAYGTAGRYRYGFNGKENDNEVKGVGNQQDYGMRIYDPKIGKFLSVDPLNTEYPWFSPYQFAGNTPIQAVDLDGQEPFMPLLGMQEIMVDVGAGVGRVSTMASGGGSSSFRVGPGSGGNWMNIGQLQPWVSPNFGPGIMVFRPQLTNSSPNQTVPQQASQKNPLPQANPNSQFNPRESPNKEDDEIEKYYIYETGSSDKVESGIVEQSAGTLPYYGITKNALIASKGVNGRYAQSNERAKNAILYKGILGKTDYYTAAGVEAALIALNTYGKNFEKTVLENKHRSRDVKKSTRIDNKMFSNKDREMIRKGMSWLKDNYGKGWKKKFLNKENKKGRNNQE